MLTVALALAGLVGAGSAAGQTGFATTIPERRTDPNSEVAHTELANKARNGVIDVYFVGDSITRRWGALDYPELLANWNENFFGWNAANFAWGGDRTQNILWRLENGELDGLEPGVFVVQAGTNNLGDWADGSASAASDTSGTEPDGNQAAAIAAGIVAIVDACLSHVPDAFVVLTGIFPRRDRPEFNPVIETINAELAAYADGAQIRYIDVNGRLSGTDGRLLDTMSDDGLHLSLPAYQIWADALRPIFEEVLGPPADRDSAPPPTGNPAAR